MQLDASTVHYAVPGSRRPALSFNFSVYLRHSRDHNAHLGHLQLDDVMLEGRTPLALDKGGRPVEFSRFRWSSVASPWSGFVVEAHRLGPKGQLTEFYLPHTLIGLCTEGCGKVEFGSLRTMRRILSTPGKFIVLNRGFEQRRVTWSGIREVLYVAISTAQLQRLSSPDLQVCDLAINPQYGASDSQLAALMLNMRAEIRAGCPTGRLYGESLSLAMLGYLQGRYGHTDRNSLRPGHTFSAAQIQQLRDYIHTDLSRDLGLNELATLVGLSPHYFSQLFKNTFGLAPHHYLLRERVIEGQRLLGTRRMPISEVAVALGFADQSHFTQVFRKLTGTTPSRYQRGC
jgi:AraC family transcriptional regulator